MTSLFFKRWISIFARVGFGVRVLSHIGRVVQTRPAVRLSDDVRNIGQKFTKLASCTSDHGLDDGGRVLSLFLKYRVTVGRLARGNINDRLGEPVGVARSFGGLQAFPVWRHKVCP